MFKICLVQPFVKLGVRGVGLREFLLNQDTRIGEHLEVFSWHLGPSTINNNAL
jgi:hypothetical protein